MRLGFLLGAGASVDSGLSTYRGQGGMYRRNSKIHPEDILTEDYFNQHPDQVWKFLSPLLKEINQAKHGPTYALLEEIVSVHAESFILTQNIDGLAKPLSAHCLELHGNWEKGTCLKGHGDFEVIKSSKCPQCDSYLRPNIVLFGSNLDRKVIKEANRVIQSNPKYFVVIGTGLHFPYLRDLVDQVKVRGCKVIHINPDPDYADNIEVGEMWIRDTSYNGLKSFQAILA